MNSLEDLIDISDTLSIEDSLTLDNYCDENEQDDIVELVLEQLYEYINEHVSIYSSEKFDETIYDVIEEYIIDILHYTHIIDNDDERFEILIDTIISKVFDIFFSLYPKRSHKTNDILKDYSDQYKKDIDDKLQNLYKINETLPEQRTQEWYEMRYNLLSASSIWKALGSQSNKNAIIYDKCKPLNTEKYGYVNVNSPFHWGQKYEPVAQMYYEYEYNASIKEYGCIPHPIYDFIGASPDGINVKKDSERYGRMLEIKNIVNREITGIPKKEYWIQTQLQMETCDLYECDFLECRFKEYSSKDEFDKDGDFKLTATGNHKGIILYFEDDNNIPLYEYMPFKLKDDEYSSWVDRCKELHTDIKYIDTIYWRLDEVSCVLIERNKEWFNSVVNEFREIWETIIIERKTGFHHREPTRRVKKCMVTKIDFNEIELESNIEIYEDKSEKKVIKPITKINRIITIDT